MKDDPHQTKNLVEVDDTSSPYQLAGRALEEVLTRLNALVMVLKTCRGTTCSRPWESLHPDGSIWTLKQALDPRLDSFYHDQPQMWFLDCPSAYFAEWENQEPVITDIGGLHVQDTGFDWRNHWQHFT